jgi:hypothetical protein
MHRTYTYKNFTVDVDAQPIDAAPEDGIVLSTPVGYIAVVNITLGKTPMTTQPLHVGRDGGRLFATEAEALMRGFGTAQFVIDRW